MNKGAYLFVIVSLFLGTITLALAIPGLLDGFRGIVIWSFLFYCGLIVVAQLVAAMQGLKKIIDEHVERKTESKRVRLR
ncbi:MAG: hypothetical protein ACYDAI_00260 [Trichloromonadaceae bacterium]